MYFGITGSGIREPPVNITEQSAVGQELSDSTSLCTVAGKKRQQYLRRSLCLNTPEAHRQKGKRLSNSRCLPGTNRAGSKGRTQDIECGSDQ